MYKSSPPVIASIKTARKEYTNVELETSTMQLTGFLSIKHFIGDKPATCFISVDSIEEMIIENDELLKTLPCSFIPEVRLKAWLEGSTHF